jgi:hypothetical protein
MYASLPRLSGALPLNIIEQPESFHFDNFEPTVHPAKQILLADAFCTPFGI